MIDVKTYKEVWKKKSDLSNGGQATTIVAEAIESPKEDVVIKILSAQNDKERRARMYREAVNLLTLEHESLPKVIETNTEFYLDTNYKLFIVMDYISGSTLSDFNIQELDLWQKIILIEGVLRVVNYCHKRGIIHRDIKPDNIIIRDDDFSDPVLLDFGLSFNQENLDDDQLTPDGQHLGNRFLILPEQKVGEASKRDEKSDITQVVGLFFYLLTGITPTVLVDEKSQKPHQREEAKEIINKFPKHQKDIINNIFDIGFNQQIDKRWQSIQSLIDQFIFLNNSKEENVRDIEQMISQIRNKTNQQDYQDTKNLKILYDEVDKQVRLTLTEVSTKLGDDWSYIQSGGFNHENMDYDNRLAPHNPVLGLSLETRIHAFINGSELIIQAVEKTYKKELVREPLSNDHNWEQFREVLRNHYLQEISKHI